MANSFANNLKSAFDKNSLNLLWQGAVGSIVYLGVPTLLNKFVSPDKRLFDGFLGVIVGMAACLLIYALTRWVGVLAAMLIHPIAHFTWDSWYKYLRDTLGEPFRLSKNETTQTTTEDYWTPTNYEPNYILPEPKYEPINDLANLSQKKMYNMLEQYN